MRERERERGKGSAGLGSHAGGRIAASASQARIISSPGPPVGISPSSVFSLDPGRNIPRIYFPDYPLGSLSAIRSTLGLVAT